MPDSPGVWAGMRSPARSGFKAVKIKHGVIKMHKVPCNDDVEHNVKVHRADKAVDQPDEHAQRLKRRCVYS